MFVRNANVEDLVPKNNIKRIMPKRSNTASLLKDLEKLISNNEETPVEKKPVPKPEPVIKKPIPAIPAKPTKPTKPTKLAKITHKKRKVNKKSPKQKKTAPAPKPKPKPSSKKKARKPNKTRRSHSIAQTKPPPTNASSIIPSLRSSFMSQNIL
jgi:outer membrane biosynthesis protein TonB